MSTDGGATFKPLFSKNMPNVPLYPTFTTLDQNSFAIFSNYVVYPEKSYLSDTLFILLTNYMGNTFIRKEVKIPIDTSIKEISPLIVNSFFSLSKDTLVVVVSLMASTPPDPPVIFILFDRKMNYIGHHSLNSNYDDYVYDDSAIYAMSGRSIFRSRDLGKNFELIASPLSPRYYNNPNDYLSYYFGQRKRKIQNKLIIIKRQSQSTWVLFFDESTLQIDSFEVTQSGLFFNKSDTIFLMTSKNLYFFLNLGNKINLKGVFDAKSIVAEELLPKLSFIDNKNIAYLLLSKPKVGTSLVGDEILELCIAKYVPFGTNFLTIDFETQDNDIYIYSSPPYPNPTNSTIAINLYWDNLGDSDINFSFSDIFGRPINIDYSIIPTSENSALVQFNSILVQNGVYYLKVSAGQKAISFPIVIVK